MTSSLRRKHQTIVRSTPPAKGRKKLAGPVGVERDNPPFFLFSSISLAFALLIGPAVMGETAIAVADGWANGASKVTLAQHTEAKPKTKLKWLPYRPTKPRLGAVSSGAVTQRTAKSTSVPSLRMAQLQPGSAFKDPFEDMGDKTPAQIVEEILGREKAAEPATETATETEPTLPDGPPERAAEEILPPPLEEPGAKSVPYVPGQAPEDGEAVDKCEKQRQDLKQIGELSPDISATKGAFPDECSLVDDPFEPRSWMPITYTWKASGLCHKPLYFDETHLERYGHSWGPYLQPVLSGGHFFLTFPILPYKMGLDPPCECKYTLGYYRPGNCAPYMLDPLPISVRAGLMEAGVWLGGIYLIP